MVLVLVLHVWSCVVKHGLVTLVVIIILKDTETFQVLFTFSLFWARNITTVEINSGAHLFKSYIRRLPLFPSGDLGLGFGLVILVLVLVLSFLLLVLDLRIWSCVHEWYSGNWRRLYVWSFRSVCQCAQFCAFMCTARPSLTWVCYFVSRHRRRGWVFLMVITWTHERTRPFPCQGLKMQI